MRTQGQMILSRMRNDPVVFKIRSSLFLVALIVFAIFG